MKTLHRFILINLIFLSNIIPAFSQCGCLGSAVGGSMPVGGTNNIGILPEGYLRTLSFYKYIYGNRYFDGDSKADMGTVKYFQSGYIGALISYGFTPKLTIDAEFGYFTDKTQRIEEFGVISNANGSGLSHATIMAKYNFVSNSRSEFELTGGIGGRAPLYFKDSELPQHIRPSSGAYGLVLQAFVQKGFKDAGVYTFLLSRAELNTTNKDSYRYGSSLVNSIFATKSIVSGLTGLLELRSEIREKDINKDTTIHDSGGYFLTVAPQISFGFDNWTFSALYEYPVYGYYNRKQLAPNYSFAFVVAWQTDLYK